MEARRIPRAVSAPPRPPPGRRRPPPSPWRWHERLVGLAEGGGLLLLLAGLAFLVRSDPGDLVVVLAVGTVGALLTAGLVRGLAEPQDLAFLNRVVTGAILVRFGLAMVAHYLLPVGFFAPDQFTYQEVGWRTLLFLQGRGPSPWQIQDTFEVGYFYWNAFLFSIFGFAPLAPKLFNCFFGAWTALVAYRIAGELAGQGGARNAAVLVGFFPSLILWSTQNLRDTVVLLVLSVILWMAMRLRRRASGRALLVLTAALGLLGVLRDYMAVMVVFALAGSFFISPDRRLGANVAIGLVLIGLAILAYNELGLGAKWIESASFEAIATQRQLMASGRTAFQPQVDISTPLRSLLFLPVGLAFFLLSPFPWQIGSALSMMTLPEMVLWYGLLGFVASGGWFLLRRRFSRVEPILIFLALTTAIYSLVEANAGTAYRHRAQIVVFLLIFAAVGLELRRLRKRRTI